MQACDIGSFFTIQKERLVYVHTLAHSQINRFLGESFKYERRNRQGALRAYLYQKLTDYRNKNIA